MPVQTDICLTLYIIDLLLPHFDIYTYKKSESYLFFHPLLPHTLSFGFFLSALYLSLASAEETPYRTVGYQDLINAGRKHAD